MGMGDASGPRLPGHELDADGGRRPDLSNYDWETLPGYDLSVGAEVMNGTGEVRINARNEAEPDRDALILDMPAEKALDLAVLIARQAHEAMRAKFTSDHITSGLKLVVPGRRDKANLRVVGQDAHHPAVPHLVPGPDHRLHRGGHHELRRLTRVEAGQGNRN